MADAPTHSLHTSGELNTRRASFATVIALCTMGIMLIAFMTVRQYADPDMFHEMALWRHVLEVGSFPNTDPFTYTPTRSPIIHHEWGTGAVLYYVITSLGAPGLLALRYLLVAGAAIVCVKCARRRGADWPVIIAVIPLAIFLGHIGLTTVRAQLFTLLAMAALLLLLDEDRRRGGRRWWIVPWLVIYLLWLNLHAGFVVGLALCGAHWIEQVIRTRSPQWHLIGVGCAMAALTFVNPYGWRYVPFVWESAGMDRPLIPEWWPLWKASGPELLPFYVFFFAIVLIVYAIGRAGVRQLPGILIVLLCAYAAVRHQRHASLFAVALLAYVPAYLSITPLSRILNELWSRHQKKLACAFAALGVVLLLWMPNRPWTLDVPDSDDDPRLYAFTYPIGAVDYLREINFTGNVMTPFVTGAFLTWNLHPNVKVSQDGRYEVAFQPGVVEEQVNCYNGGEGWRETLMLYAGDLVLVPRTVALSRLMNEQTDWNCIYRDDDSELFARPSGNESTSPPALVDRTGQRFQMTLP